MKLSEVYALLDEFAPKTLSDEYCALYGAYDNSGVLVDTGDEIKNVVFSLDLSFGAIDKAITTGANLIVTHHPAIYGKIANVRAGESSDPLGEKLVQCIKHGVSVVAMHLNLDVAKAGIDECLCEGVCRCCNSDRAESVRIMQPVRDSGYGRVYEVKETPISAFKSAFMNVFQTERLTVYPQNTTVRRVASFCGAGVDERSVAFAIEHGADTIVSSDWKHHLITYALEAGLSVIDVTHYASEFYGFEKYYKKISQRLAVPCALHTERALF